MPNLSCLDNGGAQIIEVWIREVPLYISRHTVVCRVAQEAGAPHREYIKTHGSVSCGPRSRRATPVSILTGRTKTSFSHLCISVITYLIGTTFATQLPASQGSLHSKFEGNRSSHFRDTSCQTFVFFLRFFFSSSSSFRILAKIAITSKRVLRSPWNLAHRKGVQRRILASNLVQIRWMVQELWPIIRVKQDRFVVTPTG